jgi:hypothetical protein
MHGCERRQARGVEIGVVREAIRGNVQTGGFGKDAAQFVLHFVVPLCCSTVSEGVDEKPPQVQLFALIGPVHIVDASRWL